MTPRIKAEEVRKDNSDLWRFSRKLADALKKENNKKSPNLVYYETLEQIESACVVDPYEDINERLDLDTFADLLPTEIEKEIFILLMQGFSHSEIGVELGYSRHLYKLTNSIIDKYKQFYEENNCE